MSQSHLTVDAALIDDGLMPLNPPSSVIELANLLGDIGFRNSKGHRWAKQGYCLRFHANPRTVQRQLQWLESVGAVTTDAVNRQALPLPWSAHDHDHGGGTVSPLSTSYSNSQSTSTSRSLSTQQQEEMLRIWNSQCDQKSYLIRHKSVTSDAQRAARKHLQDFPDVALGAAVGSYLNEAERWMRKRYQETKRKFSLRAVLMFPTFGDHLNTVGDQSVPHSLKSPPPDDEHPMLKPHARSSDYGRDMALKPRPGVWEQVKDMTAEQKWNIHREAWAMYTDTPHPNESNQLLGYSQWGPPWPDL